jgi:hypothetical protein
MTQAQPCRRRRERTDAQRVEEVGRRAEQNGFAARRAFTARERGAAA